MSDTAATLGSWLHSDSSSLWVQTWAAEAMLRFSDPCLPAPGSGLQLLWVSGHESVGVMTQAGRAECPCPAQLGSGILCLPSAGLSSPHLKSRVTPSLLQGRHGHGWPMGKLLTLAPISCPRGVLPTDCMQGSAALTPSAPPNSCQGSGGRC